MMFFLPAMHVMEKTVTCGNGASREGNIIKENVVDGVDSVRLE